MYILGTYNDDISSEGAQVMLRIQTSDLLSMQLNRFEVLSPGGGGVEPVDSWRPLLSSKLAPSPLFEHITTEATLYRHGNHWVVFSLHLLDRQFRMCHTSDISREWTCKYVAEVERRWQSPQLITYAGKAHPHFLDSSCKSERSSSSSDDFEIVVSFVANTIRGTDLLFTSEYREVYTPKFMTLRGKNARR